MLTTRRAIVLVPALLGGAWLGWRWWAPGDEARIRGVLDRIADGVGSRPDESRMTRLARVSSLREEFDAEVVVELGQPFQRLDGPDAVLGTVARLAATLEALEVSVTDVDVTVSSDRERAAVTLTAEARFDQPNAPRGFDVRELQLTFRRAADRWVIDHVTVVRTLEPVVGER